MIYLILFLYITVSFINAQYEVPEAIVEAYHPKGFSVSIADEEGIKLFAFHGKINQEIDDREAGTFSKDILKPTFGLWSFVDKSTRLKIGDQIHFWTYVEYFDGKEKRGYAKDDQVFTVRKLIQKPPGNDKYRISTTTKKSPITSTTTTTTTPAPIQQTSDPDNGDPCELTVTVINGGTSTCKGKMIFSEAFFSAIRSKYWTIEKRFAGKPDYEFVLYTDRPETIFVADGALKIKPVLADKVYGPNFVEEPFDLGKSCTGAIGTSDCQSKPDGGFILPPVLSARITTQNKFSFKYGKVEVKAKLPKGDWLYPILTLTPVHEEYGPGYESGQIRIAFTAGNEIFNRNAYGGVILGNSPVARTYGMKSIAKRAGWSSEYHRFGLIWRQDQITLTVNDKTYGTILPPDGGFSTLASMLNIKNADRWKTGSALAPFDKEMYISVGVGVGGFNFEDRTDGTKPWKNGERLSVKKFHIAQQNWSSTWSEESALIVEYIRVSAL